MPQAPHPPELTFQAGRGNKAKSFHSWVDREKGCGRKESVREAEGGSGGSGGVAFVMSTTGKAPPEKVTGRSRGSKPFRYLLRVFAREGIASANVLKQEWAWCA